MASRSRNADTTSGDRSWAEGDWLTTAKASDKTGVPRSTLRRWAQRHSIRTRTGADGERLLSIEDILAQNSRRRREALRDVAELVTVDQAKQTQALLERALVAEKGLETAQLRADHERSRRLSVEEMLTAERDRLQRVEAEVAAERKKSEDSAERARTAEIEAAELRSETRALRAEAKARVERRWWQRR